MAGPAIRARLNARLLSETAALKSERGTCSPTEDCHAGAYKAAPQPMSQSAAAGQPAVYVTAAIQGQGHGSVTQTVTLQVLGPGHGTASVPVTVSC